MRKFTVAMALGAAVTTFSALPVVTFPAVASPKPVKAKISHLALGRVAAGTVTPPEPGGNAGELVAKGHHRSSLVLTPSQSTKGFKMLGVTWHGSGASANPAVWVRTHTHGKWSGWQALDYDTDEAPDPNSTEGRTARDGTAPLWVGSSDGVQVRVDTVDGKSLPDLRAELVDPGDSAADASPAPSVPTASASAAVSQPTIYTRKQWGADESLRTSAPKYGTTIKVGFIHHTVSANSYSAADVPGLIRGIYAYHVLSNGWSDIGYNFLVDKFGRLWEGRYGGIARPVIGAHTMGYNVDTFAVSAIGNYQTAAAPAAMTTAIAHLMAWKLGMYHRDPTGWTTLGTTPMRVISGHRDANQTECPGQYLYGAIPGVRTKAKSLMSAVAPTAVDDSRYDLAAAPVSAGHALVALRTSTGATQVRDWTAASGLSSTAANLGGVTNYGPAVVRDGQGLVHVFVTGTDGHVYTKVRSATGTWSASWVNVGGALTSRPSAVLFLGQVNVFGRGSNGSLQQGFVRSGRWTWVSLGGSLAAGTGPATASALYGGIDVVALAGNHSVWHKTYRLGSGWSGWHYLNGSALRSPAIASSGYNRLTVVIRGTDSGVYAKDIVGSTAYGWKALSGFIVGSPTAVGTTGRLDVFAVARMNGGFYSRTRTTSWAGWVTK